MPGNGTFNLSRLWQALGVKNPQSTLSERVQPVINVGQLGHLTPRFVNPTNLFGGDVAGAAGDFSAVVLLSRAPGGTNILFAGVAAAAFGTVNRGLDTVIAPNPMTVSGNFSARPFLSLVQRGRFAAVPVGGADVQAQLPAAGSFPTGAVMWIPPGERFFISALASNSALLNFLLLAEDLEAAQLPGDA